HRGVDPGFRRYDKVRGCRLVRCRPLPPTLRTDPPSPPAGLCTHKVPSFRGAAEGGEPGTYIPEACVYGFRARRCAAPRNDGIFCSFCTKPRHRGKLVGWLDFAPAPLLDLPALPT